jgi:hypothetical protein
LAILSTALKVALAVGVIVAVAIIDWDVSATIIFTTASAPLYFYLTDWCPVSDIRTVEEVENRRPIPLN